MLRVYFYLVACMIGPPQVPGPVDREDILLNVSSNLLSHRFSLPSHSALGAIVRRS